MLQSLYNLIIYPLTQIIEIVYIIVHKVFKTSACPAGYAIIGVSVAITFLCLPLYVVAEKWQQIERDTQKKLKPEIDRIKAAFKGDEQYMILSTYYRQNHYHPMMALRSSFGLLIQVPFFMAAYQYLSNLDELVGLSFLFIKNLGTPDATFHIGNFPINILPIAMTLINCIAGAIYTKGFGIKDKLQVYGMAAVFLVILYNSPAGLVLYWTMNNIFSLIKNVFYKIKNPLKVLYIMCCVAIIGMDYFIFFHHSGFLHRRLMLIGVISIVFFIPLIIKVINLLLDKFFCELMNDSKKQFALFIVSAIVLCVLTGLYIPSTVVASSPEEFSFIDSVSSPFTYLGITFFKSLGLCVFWPICIFFLFQNKRIKTCMAVFFAMLAIGALCNSFLFPGKYGNLSPIMTLDIAINLKATLRQNLINIFSLLLTVIAILAISALRKDKWLTTTYSFVAVALIALSFVNFSKTKKSFNAYGQLVSNSQIKKDSLSPIFHLSKTEDNVFVIDLDRAVGAFIPEILNEKPELKNIFDGFIYYPNTASFGECTITGSPPMFGGYEYTPKEMTIRKNESLVSKHNEALLTMPIVFGEHGFNVTVTDPSFANYSWTPDLSIFDDYKYIDAHNTIRAYTDLWISNHSDLAGKDLKSKLIKRNLFWYSLMRSFPTLFRDTIYNDGNYWNSQKSESDLQSTVNNYAVLDYMPELTDFTSNKPSYTFMVNELTHEPAFLQAPDYQPSKTVTNIGTGIYKEDIYYHANIAALLRIGEWLEHLKQNDVYDNTRIIIVSDHGWRVSTDVFGEQKSGVWKRYEAFNPVLLVKDFKQHGEIKFDYSFMTNADVPMISCTDLIKDPINPFSKKPINNNHKQNGIACIEIEKWAPDSQNKNSFKSTNWFSLENNLFDNNNWNEFTQDEIIKGVYE